MHAHLKLREINDVYIDIAKDQVFKIHDYELSFKETDENILDFYSRGTLKDLRERFEVYLDSNKKQYYKKYLKELIDEEAGDCVKSSSD